MVSTLQRNSNPLHRLARFVSKQAAAMMFNRAAEEIYAVERWAHIVYVRGKGVSRFVSYADFPPSLEVAPPSDRILLFGADFGNREKSKHRRFGCNFLLPSFTNPPQLKFYTTGVD